MTTKSRHTCQPQGLWALLLGLWVALSPLEVRAEQDEHLFALSGAYVLSEAHGGGLGLAYQYGLTDFWNLAVSSGWDMSEEGQGLHLGLGTLYHIDAFQWVPYLSARLCGYGRMPASEGEDSILYGFGGAFGAGVDYRPSRRWGVGLYSEYHVLFVGEIHDQLNAGVRFNLYF